MATKKNKIMTFVGKWMDLENIILREVNPDPERQRGSSYL